MDIRKSLAAVISIVLLAPSVGRAQTAAPAEASAEGEGDQFSGNIDLTGQYVRGADKSAKAEEHRDLPNGAIGNITFDYQKSDGRYLQLDATNIAYDDQAYVVSAGKAGSVRIEGEYNEIPHRFAYGAVSLYEGVGSENMTLPVGVQQYLQSSTSLNEMARKLSGDVSSMGQEFDVELLRKRGRITAEVYAAEPLTVTAEFKREKREGGQPFSGSFGLNNLQELVQPINYDTTEYRLTSEWNCGPATVNLNYYASVFNNNDDTLRWANPLRASDSTSPSAYVDPLSVPSFGVFENEGAAGGLIDLAPDNMYNTVSANGVYRDLPWRSTMTGNVAVGWMKQNDSLVPYTTNTAIQGANVPGGAPFSAVLPSSLPTDSVDASVQTQLYNFILTSVPLSFMDFKGQYRFYNYDNGTDVIQFPGSVRFDAVWEQDPIANMPNSFDQHTAKADLGFDLTHKTKFTVGYEFDQMGRENREVNSMSDNIVKASVDSRYWNWMTLRLAYDHGERSIGTYNAAEPFPSEEEITNLPFLRKYDEAARRRDDVRLMATVMPIEPLAVNSQFLYGRDDFEDSDFGLQGDTHYAYGLDANYAFKNGWNVFAFYNYENFNSDQQDRQWNAGGLGDPFVVDTGINSFSNWDATNEDSINTFGGGVDVTLSKDFAFFSVTYSYSDANGRVNYSSPLGTPANDANFFIPADFTNVDDVNLQTFNPKLTFKLTKAMSLVVGYLYERFSTNDYTKSVELVPTTATGAYNGALLMGTLPYQDYDVNIVYSRLNYKW